MPASNPTPSTTAAPVVGVALAEASTAPLDVSEADSETAVEAGERLVVLLAPDTSEEADATSATSTLVHITHTTNQTEYTYHSQYL